MEEKILTTEQILKLLRQASKEYRRLTKSRGGNMPTKKRGKKIDWIARALGASRVIDLTKKIYKRRRVSS